jgi:hypothetical protein
MSISFTLAWWHIPALVTVLSILWAAFWPADTGGFLGGVTRLFMLVPALFISLMAWAICGALK